MMNPTYTTLMPSELVLRRLHGTHPNTSADQFGVIISVSTGMYEDQSIQGLMSADLGV